MHLPPPFVRPQITSEPPALVYVVSRTEDVLWNRPVFKAPPLVVQPPVIDATAFVAGPAQFASLAS